MDDLGSLIERAKNVLKIEAEAVSALLNRISKKEYSAQFLKAVELIYSNTGRVIVTGIGKSGLIGEKIAATMRSTGTPAIFLHPVEAVHGDLGIVTENDIILTLSYKGETEELIKLVVYVKRFGIQIITFTGNLDSTLARYSDVVLDVSVEREACLLGLAPTASTTAMLAMGDALSIVLMEKRNFKEKDFAFFHPGGSLGRKLLLKVDDVMAKRDAIPRVDISADMADVILEMTGKKLGMTLVFDRNSLVGIVTDGDLRRGLEKYKNIMERKVTEIMTYSPRYIKIGTLAEAAIKFMEEKKITSLPVLDCENNVVGVVHLHHLLQAKLV